MPQRSKGPRLYLHPHSRTWIIRDGSIFKRTSCDERNKAIAERHLAEYITASTRRRLPPRR